MPAFLPLVLGLLSLLLIGLALLVPAGYGLPAPIFPLIALILGAPALIVALLMYLSMIRSGRIQAFGADRLRREASDRDDRDEIPPAHEEAQRRVRSFRRAAGEDP
ncbi:MAG TPA: hypothetical protein VKA96_01905 [Solirubrobacteraceae bacterium]|nr:hypothetical protein [Solirubrobacteraceae bacterium]